MRILLFSILMLSFFLRIWQISQIPPSLNWDEVSHGYNAYSILKTGQDEWGVNFPKIFRAYGDYKLPVYIYLTALSEAIFGLNEFAVRFPSVLAGTLSVLFTFLLVRKLFGNGFLGILTALLVAVEPWGLFLSRIAVEANLASFLIIAGMYFLVLGAEKNCFLPVSTFFFGLSLYTYNSARIFVPLFLVCLIILHYSRAMGWARERRMAVLSGIFIFLVFFIPMVGELLSPEGQARYRWVSLLDEGAINRINQERGSSSLSQPLSRLAHNKLTYSIMALERNYLSYLSPNFLFFEGGSHYQFNVPGIGLIYPMQLPFILLGLWVLIKRRDVVSKIGLSWLLLSPIAGSLTRDSPHALRAITMLPIPQVLTALGLFEVWIWFEARKSNYPAIIKRIGMGIYFLVLFIFLGKFWFIYATNYRTDYSWAWQYGYKEMVVFLKENYGGYNKIIITKKYGEPHEFLLFWWPWDPKSFREDPNLVRYFRTDWYWVDTFDKFIFVNDWEIKENAKCLPDNKCALVTSPNNYPEGWKKIKTINFLDGKPAFEIYEF